MEHEYDLVEALSWLSTGGMTEVIGPTEILEEVIGLTEMAREMQQNEVIVNTDMAMTLCLLAAEALKARKLL